MSFHPIQVNLAVIADLYYFFLPHGIKAIEKEAQKSQKKFRDEMKTEEGARVRQIAAELKDQLEEMEHIAGAESFVRYFYKKTESLLEYLSGQKIPLFQAVNHTLPEFFFCCLCMFCQPVRLVDHNQRVLRQMEVIRNHQEVVHRFHQMHTLSLSTMEPRGTGWNFTMEMQLTVKSVNP